MSEPTERDGERDGERDAERDAEPHDDDFDPDSRRLCPDDTCIGVIGPDGKCKECGKESPDGPPPAAGKKTAAVAEAKPAAAPKKPAAGGDSDDFDPDSRTLCSDDTCTGLIGADGKCKECGKPHEG